MAGRGQELADRRQPDRETPEPGDTTVGRLAVVVVNYNTRDLLRTCLGTIQAAAQAGQDGLQVCAIVVDNASQDDSAGMVSAEFPDVRLLACQENLGFTGGNNLALRELGFEVDAPAVSQPSGDWAPEPRPIARPDWVLFLNPDAALTDSALGQLVSFLLATPEAGVCGAHLHYGDGSFQHGAFRFPGLFQVGLDLFPLAGVPGAHRLHNSRWNGRYPARLWQGGRPFAADFVLGAAMMVRGQAIAEVGGLDNGFFMYCEEMDWCLRMQEAGWRVFALPTAHVIHHEGQSSRQVRWPAFAQLWCSRFRFFRKHALRYPPGYLVALRWLVQAGLALRRRQAGRRFAQGRLSEGELADELAAYRRILQTSGAEIRQS